MPASCPLSGEAFKLQASGNITAATKNAERCCDTDTHACFAHKAKITSNTGHAAITTPTGNHPF